MAQTQLYTKRTQVHCVAEAAAVDTYIAPTAATIFLAQNATVTFNADDFTPEYHRGDVLNMPRTAGPVSGTISFDVPARSAGDAGDIAPDYAACLQAGGLAVTASAGVSHTYRRSSVFDAAGGNPDHSYSVSVLIDGTRHALGGAFCEISFVGNVNTVGMWTFTFQGQYQAYAADALETVTYVTTVAPGFRGATFVLSNFTVTPWGQAQGLRGVTNFSFALNNQIALGADVNYTNGFYGARLVPGGRPSGSFDCENVLPASFDFFADHLNSKVGKITTGAIGTAANQYTITFNGVQIGMPERVVKNGIETLTVPFVCSEEATELENTAADDFELVFT